MTPEQPQWNLLPDQPEEFFGLQPGFDRTELKRRYNTFIRAFKPEKHPQEFMKIRAAYEDIDNRLRYMGHEANPNSAPGINSPLGSLPAQSGAVAKSEGRDLVQDIPALEPDELFVHLRNRAEKSPKDYIRLAILSDLEPQRRSNDFLSWLLSGVGEFPNDPALVELLRQYCLQYRGDKDPEELLEKLSSAIRDERFYYVTEKLWLELLIKGKAEIFPELLSACERNLRFRQQRFRTVFYLRLLKAAFWTVDAVWVRQTHEMLMESGELLPHDLQEELFVLEALMDYKLTRGFFLTGSPRWRMELDDLIHAWSLEAPEILDQKIILFFQMVKADEASFLAAMPLNLPGGAEAFEVFNIMTEECFDRAGRHEEEHEIGAQAAGTRKSLDLLRKIERKTEDSFYGSFFSLFSVLSFVAIVAVNWVPGLILFLTGVLSSEGAMLGSFLLSLCLYLYFLRGWANDLFTRNVLFPWGRLCYYKLWRTELVSFQKTTGLHFINLVNALGEFQNVGEISFDGYLRYFASQDVGLAILSQANRIVR